MVNHPYTFTKMPQIAYISYSKESLPSHIRCESHVFVMEMQNWVLLDHPEIRGEKPSGYYRCELCGWRKDSDWVMAWAMGAVE